MYGIDLKDYSDDIDLYVNFNIESNLGEDNTTLVNLLLNYLGVDDYNNYDYKNKRKMLHAKINTLPPKSFDQKNTKYLNKLLQNELSKKYITDLSKITENAKSMNNCQIKIWKGDISTLKIDSIVNAANSQLLGCFQPLHHCIDNVIHSNAGVQLRDDCYRIISIQGYNEPVGCAKITRAYNLPSKFVIHTVGPIVNKKLNESHIQKLSDSYTSCLNLCKRVDSIKSIAFCCISTGVYGYPQLEAATNAYNTVINWLKVNPNVLSHVVFNVFTDKDFEIYKSLLEV